MKFTKNLFALLLTAVLVFTMSIPAFAAVATDVVTAEAGETVSLTYTYTDVAGIYGAFTLSNPDMVSSFKITIPDLGLEEVEYNEADGRFSYFLSDNMTFDIVLEVVVSSTAKAGDKCEVTFKHEAVSEDGVLPEEENFTVDTITIVIEDAPVVLDYSKLEALIDEANALVEDEYTEESWKAMSEVLAGAEALIGNAGSQKEIDDMVAALQAAIDALVKKTPVVELDYSKLEEMINSVDKLNKDNYTKESWDEMLKVLEKAKELLKNKNAKSQDEIDNLTLSLDAAIKALVGKYGDNATVIYAIVAMLMAAVATVVVLMTRKKVRN